VDLLLGGSGGFRDVPDGLPAVPEFSLPVGSRGVGVGVAA
jgi:hypothetical protein